MHLELQKLGDKYTKIARQVGPPSTVDQLLVNTNFPCSAGVMVVPLPLKFKVLYMELYDGTKDPLEQLDTFKAHMNLHDFFRKVACQAFPLTLKRAT